MTWPLGVQLGWEDFIVRGESVLQEVAGLYCSKGKKLSHDTKFVSWLEWLDG